MSNSAKQIDKQIGLFYEIPRLIMIVQRLDKVIELLQSKQPPD